MARKKKEEAEKENSERWLLTYADMITLLMLFFIVLYSMSQTDVAKFTQLSQVLETVFAGGSWGIFESKPNANGKEMFDSGKGLLRTADKNPLVKNKQPAKKKKTYNQVITVLQPYIKADKIRVVSTETGITISLNSDLFFDPGSAQIVTENTAVLDSVANVLKGLDNNIRVEGHTDNQPITATHPQYRSNWELSSQRSINILEYFETRDVPSKNMSAVAFGSTRPIEDNNIPEGRAYNRRVDVVIVDETGLPTGLEGKTQEILNQ